MELNDEKIDYLIGRMHVYENHDYPVMRIIEHTDTGETIPEREYEQVLKKIFEYVEKAKKWEKYVKYNDRSDESMTKSYMECIDEHNIVVALKEHYIGTPEHISDCAVCAFLKPIMEGNK